MKSPISILFAHLYHKHNETNEGSFEDIINECCDIIDYSFYPNCTNSKKIKFNIGSCDPKTQLREITYINCKYQKNEVQEYIECDYIPLSNYKGYNILFFVLMAFTIEFFFLTIIIK